MKPLSTSGGLDLKSFEVNPNYKPDGDEPIVPQEPVSEPQQIIENGDEPTTPQEPTATEPTVNKPDGDEPVVPQEPVSEPDESSLKPNNEPVTPTVTEPTDDIIFDTLSEKLGKPIKSYEDLIQKPVEIDPTVKELNEWSKKTGRPIQDYFKYQKDYSQVSDLEVAREFLQNKYPTLNDNEINLELQKYTPSDEDLENEVALKNLELKKLATEGRQLFEGLKMELSQPSQSNIAPEIKQKLEFADQVQQQIDLSKSQQEEYSQGINTAALGTESINFKLSDDLSLDFKLSEEDRKSLPTFINEMPHWRTETGEWNHKAVIEDSIKIKFFDKIKELVFEQGVNFGKEIITKDVKNTTLGNTQSQQPDTSAKKPTYSSSIDKLLGKQTIKIRK